ARLRVMIWATLMPMVKLRSSLMMDRSSTGWKPMLWEKASQERPGVPAARLASMAPSRMPERMKKQRSSVRFTGVPSFLLSQAAGGAKAPLAPLGLVQFFSEGEGTAGHGHDHQL